MIGTFGLKDHSRETSTYEDVNIGQIRIENAQLVRRFGRIPAFLVVQVAEPMWVEGQKEFTAEDAENAEKSDEG